MRTRNVLWGLCCAAAATAVFMPTAHADRRTGLGGNLLIQDPDDLFPFPQYTHIHRNMIRLDYGAPVGGDTNRGNGVLTLGGEKRSVGVALHRGDLLSPDVVGFNTELAWVGGITNPFGAAGQTAFPAPALTLPGGETAAAATTLPATVADLMYAQNIGRDALGIRLGYGRGVQSVTTEGETSKSSSSFFVGQFGYSFLPPEGLRVDVSANLMAAFGKATLNGDTTNRGFDLRLGALTRGYYALNTMVDLAFLGNLSVDNERGKSADTKSNDFSTTLMGGVGPAIHIPRAQIAAYGGFTMGAGKNTPDTDDNDSDVSRINFLAPMVNMAVEVQLLDWLYVRTAAQYVWQLDRYKGSPEGETRRERHSTAPFAWAVGLGVTKNNFYFDGVIQNALVTGGPTFIGGAENGFLAMASATYKFGDVFAGASLSNKGRTAPAQEVAPPPPPPPPPAPAEVEPAPEPAVVDPVPAPGASVDAAATGSSAQASATVTTGAGASAP
ncbi:MAG TPA: hypothetical protein VFZ61_10205 [Polyangiales bacterium]